MPRKDPIAAKEYWAAYRKTDKCKERQARWKEKNKAWRQSEVGRDELYDLNLRKLYGITIADYYRMLAAQGECCAICGRHQSSFKKRLCVDHCHRTSVVRGLLCMHCNHAIGKLGDDPSTLRRAADYLEVKREVLPLVPKPRQYRRRGLVA